MAKHFERLDEEGRALHDSWDQIARVVVLVTLLAMLVWGVCTALRQLVHVLLERVLHEADHPTARGGAILVAKLVALTGVSTPDPALFAVVGIASSLVAVIGVPLAAIALVFEVFGKAFGPPAIVACGVTYLVTLRIKIYKHQRLSPTPVADENGA